MAYRLATRRLDRLTPSERVRLNLLTLKGGVDAKGVRWNSAMREEILWRKEKLEEIQLFLAYDQNETIVAWSSVMPAEIAGFPGGKQAYIYTYVMRAHRRNRIGTQLINRAIAWCSKRNFVPRVIRSTQNSRFFATISHKMRVDLAGY